MDERQTVHISPRGTTAFAMCATRLLVSLSLVISGILWLIGKNEEESMSKYRKKPIEIEAVQWKTFGDHPAVEAGWIDPIRGTILLPGQRHLAARSEKTAIIKTLEGWHEVRPGDWIIAGIKGELYPCKPDIFELTYEAVQ